MPWTPNQPTHRSPVPATASDATVPYGISPAWYDFIDRAPGVVAGCDGL
jgi:hypothetical protein